MFNKSKKIIVCALLVSLFGLGFNKTKLKAVGVGTVLMAAGASVGAYALLKKIYDYYYSHEPSKPANIKGDYSYAKEYLTWLIKKKMEAHGLKGVSVALVDDQDIVWAKGFGFSDVENGIPATKDTIYGIGSISKLFTGIAVMQLHEQGKIDINRPIQTYIPEFSVKAHFNQLNYPPITPRNLLTHHSGLFCDLEKGISSSLQQQPKDISLLDYLDILKNEYTSTPAGLVRAYSNVGFSLLGALVEKVTRQNFSDYADKNIFQKLNMQKTSFGLPSAPKTNFAKAYAGDEEFIEYFYNGYPDGSVRSTVSDLAQFLKMIFANSGTILRPETLSSMLTPQDRAPLDLNDYDIGLAFKLSLSPVVTVFHGGILYPFFGTLVFLPEHKIGFVILCNSLPPASRISEILKASDDIEDAIVRKALQIALEVKTGKAPRLEKTEQVKAVVPTISLPEGELKKHVGFYSIGEDHDLAKIIFTEGQLYINLENKESRLIPRADGTFSLREDLFLSFKTVSGYDVIIKDEEGERGLWGVKLDLKPVSEAWRRRAGTYEIINATEADETEKYSLVIEDGILFLLEGDSKTVANPISDMLAVVATGHVFTLGGTTLQVVEEKGQELLLFSGFKLKKI